MGRETLCKVSTTTRWPTTDPRPKGRRYSSRHLSCTCKARAWIVAIKDTQRVPRRPGEFPRGGAPGSAGTRRSRPESEPAVPGAYFDPVSSHGAGPASLRAPGVRDPNRNPPSRRAFRPGEFSRAGGTGFGRKSSRTTRLERSLEGQKPLPGGTKIRQPSRRRHRCAGYAHGGGSGRMGALPSPPPGFGRKAPEPQG